MGPDLPLVLVDVDEAQPALDARLLNDVEVDPLPGLLLVRVLQVVGDGVAGVGGVGALQGAPVLAAVEPVLCVVLGGLRGQRLDGAAALLVGLVPNSVVRELEVVRPKVVGDGVAVVLDLAPAYPGGPFNRKPFKLCFNLKTSFGLSFITKECCREDFDCINMNEKGVFC